MRAVALTAVVLLGLARPAPAQQGPIASGAVREGTLSFDGHATMGDFTGSTSSVTGEFDGAPSLEGVHGWVSAPVQTLVTGNAHRDRDLNKSMESATYPTLRFELDGVTPEPGSADSLPVLLRGHLILHGVSREVTIAGVLALRGDQIRIRTAFPLNLKDYGIGGLTKMLGMLKMHEEITVHVDVTFGPK